MTHPREPYQTLSEQERARMRELLDLLTSHPDAEASAPIHDKIGALAELQLLIGAHNAAGSRFIRELVTGELDQLRADMHTIYDPLRIILERVGQRLDTSDARQTAMETRVGAIEERQGRIEARVRQLTALLLLVAIVSLVAAVALPLILP